MVGTLIAAFSSLVALGALVVSFLAHHHQVARAAALDVREGHVEARERELERRERRIQASMIEVRVNASRSSLHDGWVTPRVEIVNPSNQPIGDLAAECRGAVVSGVSGSVASGAARSFSLPPSENGAQPELLLHQFTLIFTDAAGTRWRRDGKGGLRRGVLGPDDELEWTDREEPVITQSRAHGYLPPPSPYPQQPAPTAPGPPLRLPRARRLGGGMGAAAVLIVILLAVALVATLARR